MVTIPLIAFEDLHEFIETYVIKCFPDQYKGYKNRMMSYDWYLAIEVNKKNGPLLLSRDGGYLHSGQELINHLSTGKGQLKILNLCWEELDEKLGSEYQREHPSIPISRTVSAQTAGHMRSGNKRKIENLKLEPDVEIKADPDVKNETDSGFKIKAELNSKITQGRFNGAFKRGRKRQNTDTEILDLSNETYSKRTLSEEFSAHAHEGATETENPRRAGMVTRKSKQMQALTSASEEQGTV